MPYRRSENVQVVIGKESTFGQGQTTPDGYAIPFAQLQLGKTRETGQSPILRGDPYESAPFLGMYRVRGSLRAAATLETIPRLARLIGGAISTSGASAPYTHTIKGSTSTPSIWAEKWFTDVGKGDRFFGLKIASLALAVGGRDAAPVLLDCDLIGSGHPTTGDRDQTSRYDTTPDVTMLSGPFHSLADASILIDGAAPSADITSIQIQIQLAHDPLDVIDGSYASKALISKWYEVTGRIEAVWDDTSALRALDGQTKNIKIKVVKAGDPTRYFQFEVPSAFCTISDEGAVQGSGVIRQTLEFRGYYDAAAQSSWVVTVANDTASYSTW